MRELRRDLPPARVVTLSAVAGTLPAMPADIDPHAGLDQLAVCPRRLLGDERNPKCRALVLVRYADEHEQWHDLLDGYLDGVLTIADNLDGGVQTAAWPARLEHAEPAPADGSQL